MWNPEEEGKTHINAYSQSRTALGKLLSNFTRVRFTCEDGEFASIEGYWYWLIADPSWDREPLRRMSGMKAKKYGRELGCEDWCDTEEFKTKIKRALWFKVQALPTLKSLLMNNNLPIVHYYTYGNQSPYKVIVPVEGQWVWEAFTVIKEHLWKNVFHFFWHGTLSQWAKSRFEVDGIIYNCAEQYMMYQKAILFGDTETAKQILLSKSPKDQKNLGRLVKNFDKKVWNQNSMRIVKEGNMAKFRQNPEMLKELLNTRGLLVEASPYDTIWGIGLKADDRRAKTKSTWRGKNQLGYVLTEVRDELKKEK